MIFAFRISTQLKNIVTGILLLLFLAVIQVAFAGEMVEECQQIKGNNQDNTDHDRIYCFKQHMDEIKQERKDIVRLNDAVNFIRGKKIRDKPKQYDCRKVKQKILQDYLEVQNKKLTVTKFQVSGGVCSSYWNQMAKARNEYARLHCHVGFSSYDEDVKRNLKDYKQNLKLYYQCFDRNIPDDIKQDFTITDRKSFAATLSKLQKEYMEKQTRKEYKDLQVACDQLLGKLAKRSPKYFKRYNPGCR